MTRGTMEGYRLALECERSKLMRGQSDREAIQIERVADSIDGSSLEIERHVSLDALSRGAVMISEVIGALGRIAAGDYRLCLECQEPISVRRLRALPWARLCLLCQEEEESLAGEPDMGHELTDAA
ncbi:MAG TPA: TraR/DksA family transcriptional regulator [Terriglobia bacterium]|nr:TraR/DksA family transcriptional regulator [Terriglobia bacterium]